MAALRLAFVLVTFAHASEAPCGEGVDAKTCPQEKPDDTAVMLQIPITVQHGVGAHSVDLHEDETNDGEMPIPTRTTYGGGVSSATPTGTLRYGGGAVADGRRRKAQQGDIITGITQKPCGIDHEAACACATAVKNAMVHHSPNNNNKCFDGTGLGAHIINAKIRDCMTKYPNCIDKMTPGWCTSPWLCASKKLEMGLDCFTVNDSPDAAPDSAGGGWVGLVAAPDQEDLSALEERGNSMARQASKLDDAVADKCTG